MSTDSEVGVNDAEGREESAEHGPPI